MNLRPLKDFPRNTRLIIESIDKADVLVTTILMDAKRDDDAQNLSTPFEDFCVYLEMIQEQLDTAANNIASCVE